MKLFVDLLKTIGYFFLLCIGILMVAVIIVAILAALVVMPFVLVGHKIISPKTNVCDFYFSGISLDFYP
ncbi:MAG: hypothetical protein ACJKSS_01120 [Patescibacteria group bacterium UBA2103]